MTRLLLIVLAAGVCALATASTTTQASAAGATRIELSAFRGHLGGGFGLAGRSLLGRRRYGYGGLSSRYRRHSLVRRVGRTLFFAYVLHLFFSHGGLSILLWIVVLVAIHRLVRLRRRRYAR